MSTDLRTLPDRALALEAELLSRKVQALKYSTTAIGARLFAEYQGKLDAAKAEAERRAKV